MGENEKDDLASWGDGFVITPGFMVSTLTLGGILEALENSKPLKL